MEADAAITLITLLLFIVGIISGRVPVDVALMTAMVVLIISKVVSPEEALAGFSNPAIFIIACFYIVSAAVRESGALHWWVMKLLGDNTSSSIFGAVVFSLRVSIYQITKHRIYSNYPFRAWKLNTLIN